MKPIMNQQKKIEVTVYDDAREFLRHTEQLFAADETKNNLILGLALRLRENPQAFSLAKPLLCTVRDPRGTVRAAGVMTPPFPLVVYSDPPDLTALGALAEALAAGNWQVSGVNGVDVVSDAFANLWEKKSGERAQLVSNSRAYELRQVINVAYPSGAMRQARAGEASLGADLLNAMMDEIDLEPRREFSPQEVSAMIERENVFFWEDDGKVVSVTIVIRPQIQGICLSGVYTPPSFRKKGYARALVAEVSRAMLARGYRLTNLFTDLSNPTSNKIYQEVGYKPVCDYHQYRFQKSR